MRHLWQENTWEEIQELRETRGGIAILPIGSVEQHGPHLPVGTDTYVADTLARDAAERSGTVALPPVWFGWSPHHMVLPGTVTIRAEVLVELLFDILRSLAESGFRKVVAINGHRIVNIAWMQIAAERAQRELGMKIVIFDPAYMSKDIVPSLGFGAVGHAEEIETSHMYYRMPELTHPERARDNPHAPRELYSVDPAFRTDTLCYVPNTKEGMRHSVDAAGGTTGEPSKASAEKGRIYHEHLVKNLLRVIDMLRKEE
jgi:creatinine amidohydrolase